MERLNFILLYSYFLCNISYVLGATECYQCSTTTKPECEALSDTVNLDTCKTTTGDDINCLMYQYSLNGRNITYRGCRRQEDTCEDVRLAIETEGKELLSCSLCDTDLCKNGVTLIRLPIVSVVITASFILRFLN